MMGEMILVEPLALNAVPAYSMPLAGAAYPMFGGPTAAAGWANLATDDPREVWQGAAGSNHTIFIDFGVDTIWDTIAIINTNAATGALLSVRCGTDADASYTTVNLLNQGPMRLPSEDVAGANGHALFVAGTKQTARYVRIIVNQPVGAAALTMGRLVIGNAFKPSLPREFGAGRPAVDSGSRERLADGGLALVSGALISGFKWVFSDLNSADLAKLWGLYRRCRTTEPLLLVEDPEAAVSEGVHYGTFVSLDAYERQIEGKSRWVMAMEDWIGGA